MTGRTRQHSKVDGDRPEGPVAGLVDDRLELTPGTVDGVASRVAQLPGGTEVVA